MEKKTTRRTGIAAPKMESAEVVAERIGVSPSAVYGWRANGTLPKNKIIRAAYLKAEGRPARKAVAK